MSSRGPFPPKTFYDSMWYLQVSVSVNSAGTLISAFLPENGIPTKGRHRAHWQTRISQSIHLPRTRHAANDEREKSHGIPPPSSHSVLFRYMQEISLGYG